MSYPIRENVVLGLRVGVSSIGWGLLDTVSEQVLDAGVWAFNAPETDRDKRPKSEIWRKARIDRRIVKRRRGRLNDILALFRAEGLVSGTGMSAIAPGKGRQRICPWTARADGLDRQLTAVEFAVALYHLAKHRGLQSTRKAVVVGEHKVLKAVDQLSREIASYRTYGEALFKDPVLSVRKRNGPNSYGRTPRQDWVQHEVRLLFDRQRDLGGINASVEFEAKFLDLAFSSGSDDADGDREPFVQDFRAGEKQHGRRRMAAAMQVAHLRGEVVGLTATNLRRHLALFITNPRHHFLGSAVTRKCLLEGVKQFVALLNDHPALAGALPGEIHVELARDVGKSAEERAGIRLGRSRRERKRRASEEAFIARFSRQPQGETDELLRFELAEEQGWQCLYTGQAIEPTCIFDADFIQTDHILPWDRFCDDSFLNLTLCLARAKALKAGRTPFEWMSGGELGAPDVDGFRSRVGVCQHVAARKKRNYLLPNAEVLERAICDGNLFDKRWAACLFIELLSFFYPVNDGMRRCFAHPGTLASALRQAWQLGPPLSVGTRISIEDDRYDAGGALVVAGLAKTPSIPTTDRLSKLQSGGERLCIALPWPSFRDEVRQRVAEIVVARAESRRGRGQGHKETVHRLDDQTQTVFERVSPAVLLDQVSAKAGRSSLRRALEERFERPERSHAIIKALLVWQAAGRPASSPPLGPTGDRIGKIRVIASSIKPGVSVRGGTAERGEMARVDVFSKASQRGARQFFLVPIYPHQIASEPYPPNQAIKASTSEVEWPVMGSAYNFEFSLAPKSWIEVVKKPGDQPIAGYFRGVDRSNGGICISPHQTLDVAFRSIGPRNLADMRKYQVDRLGKRYLVVGEQRTWRGKVVYVDNELS